MCLTWLCWIAVGTVDVAELVDGIEVGRRGGETVVRVVVEVAVEQLGVFDADADVPKWDSAMGDMFARVLLLVRLEAAYKAPSSG